MTNPSGPFVTEPDRYARFGSLGRVCRLGLATRGNTHLDPDDVLYAIDRGVNYLNWCTHPDGMSAAVRQLGTRRKEVILAAQLYAHTADEAEREIEGYLAEMQTDYLDALTFYYLESDHEWQTILSDSGAMKLLEKMKTAGVECVVHYKSTAPRRSITATVSISWRGNLSWSEGRLILPRPRRLLRGDEV